MTVDIDTPLSEAVGETIEIVIPRGYGAWVVVTNALIVHVNGLTPADASRLRGRTVIRVARANAHGSWTFVLNDESRVVLAVAQAVKRHGALTEEPSA